MLNLIRAETHADIGADHAHLPIQLVQRGRVRRCIVVELNAGPLAHARQNVALAGLTGRIEVREGSGFTPLLAGEVQSASITGMGANTILSILNSAAGRLSPALIVQPNDSPRTLREWAMRNGFHLVSEALAAGFWVYPVLRFEARSGPDPVYQELPLEAALRYGPHLLRSRHPLILQQVQQDMARLTPLAAPGRPAHDELNTAKTALEILGE